MHVLVTAAFAVVAAFFVILFILFGLSVFEYCCARHKFRHIPGPTPSYPLGNTDLLRDTFGRTKPFPVLHRELHERFGDVCVFYMGCRPIILISDADDIRDVCDTRFHHFSHRSDYVFLWGGRRAKAFRAGIYMAKQPLWAHIRHAGEPLFRSENMEHFSGMMRQAAEGLLRAAKRSIETSTPVNMHPVFQHYILSIIFKCTYGVDLPSRPPPKGACTFAEACVTYYEQWSLNDVWNLMAFMLPAVLTPLVEHVAVALDPRVAKVRADMHIFFAAAQQMAEAYVSAHLELKLERDDAVLLEGSGMRPLDVEVMPSEKSLIAAYLHLVCGHQVRQLSSMEFLAQNWNFIVSGYSGSNVMMCSTMQFISCHPDSEAMLLAEIDRNGSARVSSQNVHLWPFAMACIQEALRLMPPVPLQTRVATQNTYVGRKRYSVPRGTDLHLSYRNVNMNPLNFPDPHIFKPERFIPSSACAQQCQAHKFTPLGIGPRGCPAKDCVWLEALIGIVTVYREYVFRLCPKHHPGDEVRMEYQTAYQPANGLWLQAVKR